MVSRSVRVRLDWNGDGVLFIASNEKAAFLLFQRMHMLDDNPYANERIFIKNFHLILESAVKCTHPRFNNKRIHKNNKKKKEKRTIKATTTIASRTRSHNFNFYLLYDQHIFQIRMSRAYLDKSSFFFSPCSFSSI